MTVYFGAVNIAKTRYALKYALLSDLAGIGAAIFFPICFIPGKKLERAALNIKENTEKANETFSTAGFGSERGGQRQNRRKIGQGLLVFLGVEKGDESKQADYLANKLVNLRILKMPTAR